MTRILRRRPAPAERRDRIARRGRHRIERPARRRAAYAAAGLLAVTGAAGVTPALRPEPTAAVTTATTVRPLARPAAAKVVATRPRRAAPVRKTAYRWVTRTVDGPVLHGRATWYGPGFDGRRTASGEVFHSNQALTAAHRTLPFGTRLRVCYRARCVVVRINDRGPFGNAILDLSHLAADRLGLVHAGIGHVTATVQTTERVRVPA